MKVLTGGLSSMRFCAGLLVIAGLVSGCASAPKPLMDEGPSWTGRMALRVDSEPVQSISGGFNLRGSAAEGALVLTTPLGTTVASASWDSNGAEWRQGQHVVRKASLPQLASELGGAALPVTALFSWLKGEALAVDGWQADLSRHAEGRVTAKRISPPPGAELRLIIDP